MVNEFLENSEVLFAFSVVQICFGNLFNEFIDRGFSHEFESLLSPIVVVEASFLYFLLLILPHFFFFILSPPR